MYDGNEFMVFMDLIKFLDKHQQLKYIQWNAQR